MDDIRHVGGDVLTVDEDDIPRVVPNRAEKRRLLRKLGRLPAGRTGRPWPFVRKTGRPEIYGQILLARLRALGDLSKGEAA